MSLKKVLATTAMLSSLAFMGHAASAAVVLGSHVDSSVFSAAIGATTGWTYIGQNTSAFVGPGSGEMELRSSTFSDSFGYGNTAYGNTTTVFGSSAAQGATASITGLSPNYLFWFNANSSGSSDDNTAWTDGHTSGGSNSAQADIDIFRNVALNTWAFFYDDGGPAGFGDDNDYNDMVVTFRQNVAVPEPATMGLLALGLLAAGIGRKRKQA